MSLTAAQALTQIQSLSNPTVAQIRGIVAQVDVSIPQGNSLYLYSGQVNGTPTFQIVGNIQGQNNNLSYINNTEVFNLLTDPNFEAELNSAILSDPNNTLSYSEIMDGKDASGVRVNNTSLWDTASGNLAANASGDVKIIAPIGSSFDGVLHQTEIPALLENPDVTHINGIPKAEFQAIHAASGDSGLFHAVKQSSIGYFSTLTDLETGTSLSGASMLESHKLEMLGEFGHQVFSSVSLKALGLVGAVIDLGYLAYDVGEKLSVGDTQGALDAAADWVITNVEGAIGSAAAVALLTLMAPAVITAAAAGSIVAGAAIIATAITGSITAIFAAKVIAEQMDLADSPAPGTKIPLGSAFDKVSPGVHVTKAGELVIDENGNIKQEGSLQEWMGKRGIDAGKEITQIIDLTKIPFIKSDSGSVQASKEMAARYDFLDGFSSATYGNTFANSYVSGDKWDAVINLQGPIGSGPAAPIGLFSGNVILVDIPPGEALNIKYTDNANYNTGYSFADIAAQYAGNQFNGSGVWGNYNGGGLNPTYDVLIGEAIRVPAFSGPSGGLYETYLDPVINRSGPIAIDLDGDGVELTDLNDSPVFFDMDDDGYLENTGWVAADDGLLVIDLENDGKINQLQEINFKHWDANALTDLHGLKLAFDTNNDNVFSAADARFGEFRIWQDINQNGIADAGELKTLAEAGLVSIDLSAIDLPEENEELDNLEGNLLFGDVAINWSNSNTGRAYDVALAYGVKGLLWEQDDNGVTLQYEDGREAKIAELANSGETLDVASESFEAVYGGSGADTVFTTGADDIIVDGGAGNDTITGGTGADWLKGGAGADTINGGAGDDTLFIDAQDTSIDGGSGHDVVIVEGSAAVTLNLTNTHIETVLGNAGNDVFTASGSTVDVQLDGGAGNDTLTGGSGNDILIGGTGSDAMQGGAGDDVLFIDHEDNLANVHGGAGNNTAFIFDEQGVTVNMTNIGVSRAFGNIGNDIISATGSAAVFMAGGAGVDTLTGAAGNDTLVGDAGNDTLEGNAGDDVLIGGTGNDMLKGGEGSDQYVFGRGAGNDTILDQGTAGVDMILINKDTSPKDINLTRSGNDLVLSIADTQDTLTIQNWYLGNKIEGIVLNWDGEIAKAVYIGSDTIDTAQLIDGQDINFFAITGDDQIGAGNGNTFIHGGEGDDDIVGNIGDDVLVGGTGSDEMIGWSGNDTYYYSRGDGIDLMWDLYTTDETYYVTTPQFRAHDPAAVSYAQQLQANGYAVNPTSIQVLSQLTNDPSIYTLLYENVQTPATRPVVANGHFDTIEFADGISQADLTIELSGKDLVIGVQDPANPNQPLELLSDIIIIKNYVNVFERIEKIKFADNSTLDISDLSQFRTNTQEDTVLNGDGGNNTLTTANGYDTLNGGAGDDTLNAGDGQDHLTGGTGNDILNGGGENDTYHYSRGDGSDTINEYHEESKENTVYSLRFREENPEAVQARNNLAALNITITPQLWWAICNGNNQPQLFWVCYEQVATTQIQIVQAFGGTDVIEFGSDITVNDLLLQKNGDDLVIGIRDPLNPNAALTQLADKITITDWADYNSRLEALRFADGTEFNIAAITGFQSGDAAANTLTGTTARDWISGGNGNDVINAGSEHDILFGQEGADTLNGEDGDDEIYAGAGIDTLNGGEGNDTLFGGADNDLLHGNNGKDHLSGDAGEDELHGDAGDDFIEGGADEDTIYGGDDADEIHGGDGIDTLNGDAGNDTIYGDSGADIINAGAGNDAVHGGDDADEILGGDGDDVIYGDAGNDQIDGNAGNDALHGGTGNDTIQGGIGQNTLYGESGDDTLTGGAEMDIIFGGENDDIINGSGGNDRLHGENGVDNISGGDGNDLLRGGAGNDTLSGNANDDDLRGEEGNDNLFGGTGNDSLQGGYGIDDLQGDDGSDILDGGAGADKLSGGLGDDILYFDNEDTEIKGNGGNDTLRLQNGQSLSLSAVAVGVISSIETIDLKQDAKANTLTMTYDEMLALSEENNLTIEGTRDDQVIVNLGNIAWETAAIIDGYKTYTFDGGFTLRIGHKVNAIINSDAINNDPIATVTARSLNEDVPTSINVVADAIDIDDDTVTLQSIGTPQHGTASIVNGNILYTPHQNYHGTDSLTYTISDGNGGEDMETLTITVNPVNDAPVVANAIPNQNATQGQAFNYTFSNQAFNDVDGEALTYTATLANGSALPSWLSFNAQNRTFSGTPSTSGTVSVKVTASDGSANVNDTFDIVVATAANNEPQAPTGAGVTMGTSGNDSITKGSTADIINGLAGNDTISAGSGNDEVWGEAGDDNISGGGGNDIIYGGTGNDTLTGNGGANTFVFLSNNGQDTITDFRNDDTIILYNSPYATAQAAYNALVFASGDATLSLGNGNNITFDSIDNDDFSAITFVIENSGTPPSNTAPVAGNDSASLNEDGNVIINLLANDSDAEDGTINPANITLGNPSHGSLVNNGNGTVTYTPTGNYNGSDSFTYTVRDSQNTISNTATVSLTINAVNDAPVVANAIPNQNATQGQAFNFAFSSQAFSDVDGNPLTYTATLANGSALPSWLSFNAQNRTFSGTPSTSGTVSVRVTASDGSANVNDTFDIVVAALNTAPVAGNDSATLNEDGSVIINLLANDSDAEDGTINPANITLGTPSHGSLVNNGNGTVTYTPTGNYNGTDSFTYTVRDSQNAVSNTATVSLTINPVNDAPVVANAIPNQSATQGQAFNFAFSNQAFTDVDGDTLTYTATLANGSALPAWLSFDSQTRTLSGTPSTVDTVSIKVTASDGSANVNDTFDIVIAAPSNEPTAPTGSGVTMGTSGNDSITKGSTADIINGLAGNDTISAGSGNDEVWGEAGDDNISGGSGNDIIYGGSGNDTLNGNAGDDTLYGGLGVDQLTGGSYVDIFQFSSISHSGIGSGNRDIITDFTQAELDKIDLSGFAGTFNFIGTGAFTGTANEVRYAQTGGNTILGVDANGDAALDFEIQLTGLHTLVSNDFLL